jgi:hypothetical protein
MNHRAGLWLRALLLTVGLAAPSRAEFPFPPFQCPWHEAPDCPKGQYCCLHYWAPTYYRVRAFHTPPRYVYGCPTDPELSGVVITSYPCRIATPEDRANEYIAVGRPKWNPEAGPETATKDKAPAAKY